MNTEMANGIQMTLEMWMPDACPKQTVGASEHLARTSLLPENGQDWTGTDRALYAKFLDSWKNKKSKTGSLYYNDAEHDVKLEPHEIESHQRRLLLKRLHEYENTGLTPPEIMELKERDTAKAPEEFDAHWYKCPTCGKYAGGLKGNFCYNCGQRLKQED